MVHGHRDLSLSTTYTSVVDIGLSRGDDIPREVWLTRAVGTDSIELIEICDLVGLGIFDSLSAPEEHEVFGEELIFVGDG